jgi:hypothetical protein
VLRRRLLPDHIAPQATEFRQEGQAAAILLNPNGAVRLSGTSIWLGATGHTRGWQTVGGPVPEGSFALLRTGPDAVELIADATASRTIWYALTQDRLIASTSQRAIVAVLGSFEANASVVPWMLSSGTLGPSGGWDRRLKAVGPGQRVVLNRKHWTLATPSSPVRFRPDRQARPAEQLERLEALTVDACRRMAFDSERWIVPLSGGVDSRGLIWCLGRGSKFRTVTWGAPDRGLKHNDIDIAKRVASKLALDHEVLPLALNGEDRETLTERFLVAGEGRVAALSGYADGFAIWKQFHDRGIDGIIRGDEAFGSLRPATAFEARRGAQLLLCTDYFTEDEAARFELPRQAIPHRLERGPRESLSGWADRLYQQFRLPHLCAALTDLKSSYIEIANPLLSAQLIAFSRQLPDSLRADKRLWRDWVASRLPGIPFALHPSIPPIGEILTDSGMLELFLDTLDDDCPLLSPSLCAHLRNCVRAELGKPPEQRWRPTVRRRFQFLPRRAQAILRPAIRRNRQINPLMLAFRAFIVSRMVAILREDATSLSPRLQRTADF